MGVNKLDRTLIASNFDCPAERSVFGERVSVLWSAQVRSLSPPKQSTEKKLCREPVASKLGNKNVCFSTS